MTEVEWLTRESVDAILYVPEAWLSERKLRLLVVACLRHGWNLFPEQWQREAIESAERYAEGELDEQTREVALSDVMGRFAAIPYDPTTEAPDDHLSHLPAVLSKELYYENVVVCSDQLAAAIAWYDPDRFDGIEDEIRTEHAELMRDIFGNPFRPAHIDPRWRTPTVVAIAKAIYAERDFAAMPVLADALEEAGCDAWDVLAHARGGGGTHVRGCWLLDKLLGKG